MKFKTKRKLRHIWYHILGILTQLAILIFGLLSDKLIEVFVSMVLFFIFSPLFEKQCHSNSFYKCSAISIIVYFIITRINLKFEMSILCTIVLTFTLTCVSYYLRNLIDNTILLKEYKKRIEALDNKCIENLTENELQERLPKIPYDVVHIVYGYLHKPKTLNATGYALKCNISEATLYRYLKKVKESYENT